MRLLNFGFVKVLNSSRKKFHGPILVYVACHLMLALQKVSTCFYYGFRVILCSVLGPTLSFRGGVCLKRTYDFEQLLEFPGPRSHHSSVDYQVRMPFLN